MREVAELLAKAAEWEAVAAATTQEVLKRRYLDLAAGYRLLAKERERQIDERTINAHEPG
jgi:hypothetical protein